MSDHINYILKIEIITPVHIGAGSEKDWHKDLDYYHDAEKGIIYKLNMKKLINTIGADQLTDVFLGRARLNNILSAARVDLNRVSDQQFDFPYTPSNPIKCHIRDGHHNRPYIPGSSLKGAIRSVLFKYLREKQEEREREIFGNMNDGNEFMRFFQVGDAFFEETVLMQTKIFNLHKENNEWHGGWKHALSNGTDANFRNKGFVTTYEVLPELSESHLRLTLLPDLYQKAGGRNSKKDRLMTAADPAKELFGIINQHTREFLEKEKQFFEKYPTDQSDVILDFINYLLDLVEKYPKTCLLRMAAGSGFYSITGDWRFTNHLYTLSNPDPRNRDRRYPNGKYYKSRKFVFVEGVERPWDIAPMGFVMLTEEQRIEQ